VQSASKNAVSKFRPSARNSDSREAAARGERSEPLVGIYIIKSPEGAKEVDKYIFRPFRAPSAPLFTGGSLRSPPATIFRASSAVSTLLPVILSFGTASKLAHSKGLSSKFYS